jgi:hypothetical protein
LLLELLRLELLLVLLLLLFVSNGGTGTGSRSGGFCLRSSSSVPLLHLLYGLGRRRQGLGRGEPFARLVEAHLVEHLFFFFWGGGRFRKEFEKSEVFLVFHLARSSLSPSLSRHLSPLPPP